MLEDFRAGRLAPLAQSAEGSAEARRRDGARTQAWSAAERRANGAGRGAAPDAFATEHAAVGWVSDSPTSPDLSTLKGGEGRCGGASTTGRPAVKGARRRASVCASDSPISPDLSALKGGEGRCGSGSTSGRPPAKRARRRASVCASDSPTSPDLSARTGGEGRCMARAFFKKGFREGGSARLCRSRLKRCDRDLRLKERVPAKVSPGEPYRLQQGWTPASAGLTSTV
jgi:hypothetical protein